MRVLIACEFSGRVRDAFIAKGHDAWSCDLLPTEAPGPHIQGDVAEVMRDSWDMMIAHPPCTYLCWSGSHWNRIRPERDALTEEALKFFVFLLSAPVPRIAVENPISRVLNQRVRHPDQKIQPWFFGSNIQKTTCLWLKGLPPLMSTCLVPRRRHENQSPRGQDKTSPSPDRWKIRSRTDEGIARAMAEQWGSL